MKAGALLFVATFALGGCLDKAVTPVAYEAPEFVDVRAEVVRQSGNDIVLLSAELSNSSGVEQSGFSFGTGPGDMLSVNASVADKHFSVQVGGLLPSTRYRFYAWAGNGSAVIRSNTFTFLTNEEDVLEPVEPVTPPPEGTGITVSDKIFLKYLLGIADRNSDGRIDGAEALEVSSMEFGTDGVESLEGIEYFTNLKDLVCRGSVWKGKLEVLLLRQNVSLLRLDCSYNRIRDLRTPSSLKELVCRYNMLETMDLRLSPGLASLDCFGNSLRVLDLSPVPGLEELVCGMNSFETLDVSFCPSLRLLDLTDSPLLKTVYVVRGQKIETIIAENRIDFKYKD